MVARYSRKLLLGSHLIPAVTMETYARCHEYHIGSQYLS